jgi:hypothetical protein
MLFEDRMFVFVFTDTSYDLSRFTWTHFALPQPTSIRQFSHYPPIYALVYQVVSILKLF